VLHLLKQESSVKAKGVVRLKDAAESQEPSHILQFRGRNTLEAGYCKNEKQAAPPHDVKKGDFRNTTPSFFQHGLQTAIDKHASRGHVLIVHI
jgi:hypothetical protein